MFFYSTISSGTHFNGNDFSIFQKADGVPVHFKRGARDKIMFWITCGGIAVGLFECGKFVYSLP